MEKVIKKQKTVTEVKRYCDQCGKHAEFQCYVCHKDLCGWMGNECANKVCNRNWDTDYPDYICEDCSKVKKKYYKRLEEAEEKLNKLKEEWKEEARKVWEQKKEGVE